MSRNVGCPCRWESGHMNSRNLAARAGRWSAQHRKTAIIGWILFVVLATMAGSQVGQKELPYGRDGQRRVEASRCCSMDRADFPEHRRRAGPDPGQGRASSVDPEVTAAVKDVVQRLEKIDGVTDIESPLNKADRANTVSKDGRSVVVNFTLPGTWDEPSRAREDRRRARGRRRRGPGRPSRRSASRSTAPPPSARRSASRSPPTRRARCSSPSAAPC